MKKLITLLLVLTGMVQMASAAEHSVFFKPSDNWKGEGVWYALYMFDWTTKNNWARFEEVGTTGIYKATFDTTYDKGIIFCKMKSGTSEMNWDNKDKQSADILNIPYTNDYYYDESSNTTKDNEWTASDIVIKSLYNTWTVGANRHVAANYENWSYPSDNNKMSTTDGINYTLSIANRPLKKGSYGLKFIGNNGESSKWCGDPENYGNNYILNVTSEDFYDITYTFNRITERGSIAATAKELSPTIKYLYYVFDNKAAEWEGITAMTDKDWTECEMTENDGTYIYSITGKEMTAGNKYGSRFVEKVTATGADDQTNWLWVSNDEGGLQGCRYYNCTETGTYNVVYSFTPSANNFDITSTQPALSVTQGLYVVNSGDSWENGKAMDFDDGVYHTTLENIYNKYFALSPNANAATDWSSVIRPQNNNYSWNVTFSTHSGTGYTNNESSWIVNTEGVNVEVIYNPIDNKWAIQPYRTATIGAAGYITYSTGEKCTVTGAEAIYTIDANNTGSVHMNEMDASTIWPASEGMILKGNNGDKITINAVAYDATPSTIGTNYLIGSGNTAAYYVTAGDGIYIFNWDGTNPSSIGFYKAVSGTLGAHKAYLNLGRESFNGREFLDFNFEGETTGIKQVEAAKQSVEGYYNLAGQRVAQPTKGLYIVNGKKVIIK